MNGCPVTLDCEYDDGTKSHEVIKFVPTQFTTVEEQSVEPIYGPDGGIWSFKTDNMGHTFKLEGVCLPETD